MPLILSEKDPQFGKAFLWNVSESDEYFREILSQTSLDMDHINNWHPRRQTEWLAGRFMIFKFMDADMSELYVNSQGKPGLRKSHMSFSISHTHRLVGLQFATSSIGLDLQIKSDKIQRLAQKFCSDNDYEILGKENEMSDVELFTWSIKEAVFKAFGGGGISFKKHILLQPLKTGGDLSDLEIHLSNKDVKKRYKGRIRMIGPYCMSQVREIGF